MGAGHAEIDPADFHIGHFFRLHNGVMDGFLRLGGIHDFALADAGGGGLAEADDVKGALGVEFAHDDTDFGGAYLQTDNEVGIVKHGSSVNGGGISAGGAPAGTQVTGTLLPTARSRVAMVLPASRPQT